MKNEITLTVTTPTDRQVVLTRVFDSLPPTVFDAWTKAEHVSQWWDPAGQPLRVCEIDLRPGGAFRWVHRPVNGEEQSFSGTYREIQGPERLVFTVHPASAGTDMLATLLFREQRGRTILTITIECSSNQERDALLAMRVDVGTARSMENLGRHLRALELARHDEGHKFA